MMHAAWMFSLWALDGGCVDVLGAERVLYQWFGRDTVSVFHRSMLSPEINDLDNMSLSQ